MKLTKTQQKQLKTIAKKYHLKLVILFGSVATNKTHKHSDLDIAVLTMRHFSFDNLLGLTYGLTKIFKQDVDLSVLNSASPLLKYQTVKYGLLICGTARDFNNFKVQAIIQYIDIKKLLTLDNKYIHKSFSYAHR